MCSRHHGSNHEKKNQYQSQSLRVTVSFDKTTTTILINHYPLKLNLAPFRTSRQFSTMTASGDDGAVAVGLIDALQKWADALETQISLTHGESRTAKRKSASFRGRTFGETASSL
ncbi:Uncharacterized protein FKW44_022107, partial [Caligus rogercresseyi]